MSHSAPAGSSPTGSPRSLRCRRPAATGHRAAAGELAALAFLSPVPAAPAAARPAPVPHPRPSAE
ncbi:MULTISPECIES: hypothetical protein [unclassified Pseudonocardia]|uniref:hypothetical protein n=1 Tax=unclassified Pseudonocardia TaxID=2619320 RepID=UPI0006CB0CCA|nr:MULTISPECIES: hypothetical protein [unclassified Pseudonocardia]ALE72092.1 hypothetical protein FRP1_01170 [Pseudonocardia sp. EC080625-04]ALL75375.1 hypothetical protein AD006_08800 [Pseudonocardia sp. EC080610-09]ALL82400.1 hypothetical protein AD017_16630 [Pseudonocardia sp. EC080619-01]OLL94347.1 hypothetical protein Ae356Ps1_4244c [Pseudonocardia sp. Ae356_Ps1]OLM20867.1 hypothetical protein Ae707Ps1_5126c [Pseudonocardia sp. Ae707_Ps1]